MHQPGALAAGAGAGGGQGSSLPPLAVCPLPSSVWCECEPRERGIKSGTVTTLGVFLPKYITIKPKLVKVTKDSEGL